MCFGVNSRDIILFVNVLIANVASSSTTTISFPIIPSSNLSGV
jgi:hypothetical protein